jgi:iron complex outermembrane receptor protein
MPNASDWSTQYRSRHGLEARAWMLAAILVSGHAAGMETPSETEDARLGDLLKLLDKETEFATRSGMNADFVPGMATILSGADMLVRGARTVWDHHPPQ